MNKEKKLKNNSKKKNNLFSFNEDYFKVLDSIRIILEESNKSDFDIKHYLYIVIIFTLTLFFSSYMVIHSMISINHSFPYFYMILLFLSVYGLVYIIIVNPKSKTDSDNKVKNLMIELSKLESSLKSLQDKTIGSTRNED